jgi:2'-5' RNA ligase
VSAQAEEVTASAETLNEMAQDLQTLVAQFKLPGVAQPVVQPTTLARVAAGVTPRASRRTTLTPAQIAPDGGNGRT